MDAEHSKYQHDSEWAFRQKTRVKIRDLLYYFGEEWIDIGLIGNDNNYIKHKNAGRSAYQPKKCPVCKKYWGSTMGCDKSYGWRYYPKSVFGSVPAIKKMCWTCSSNTNVSE